MSTETKQNFHEHLSKLIDSFVHDIYDTTLRFPRNEMFGVISQVRRAALSVALNYTEGYARHSRKELARFLKISYGSLKETLYILKFAHERGWVGKEIYDKLSLTGDEIGKMLWSMFSRL